MTPTITPRGWLNSAAHWRGLPCTAPESSEWTSTLFHLANPERMPGSSSIQQARIAVLLGKADPSAADHPLPFAPYAHRRDQGPPFLNLPHTPLRIGNRRAVG